MMMFDCQTINSFVPSSSARIRKQVEQQMTGRSGENPNSNILHFKFLKIQNVISCCG